MHFYSEQTFTLVSTQRETIRRSRRRRRHRRRRRSRRQHARAYSQLYRPFPGIQTEIINIKIPFLVGLILICNFFALL